ncbi:MAG: nicotinate-nucleotide--dimethylbenzimidazole phosphoribosyltransferase, partial [Desulfobacterales bacterium]|nr:nicotinate-nucleotide--dimethylbenzimidazole phosphoribosyltransferase [Desulfobacterales bacterium]
KEFSPHPMLIRSKVAPGSRNMALEPAMTRAQAIQALQAGMDAFFSLNEKAPVHILGLGEMGIGNTTSATAIISAATGLSPRQTTGRGTGVDDEGLDHKTEVIQRILNFHSPDPANGMEILQTVGGFEIAGIAGAALAAASKGCAVVLDGVISTAAGLIAHLLHPGVGEYFIAGHQSVEVAHQAALDAMGLTPVVDLSMRLGEGTGAALAIDLADTACKIMSEMASFDEAKISRSPLK